jgi:hypothetical protein
MYKLLCLSKLPNTKHKYQADLFNTETKRVKVVKFGASGMNDYTIYNKEEGKKIADEHKKLYLARHRKREDWSKNGIDTPGFWSRWLLWNKPTLEKSLEYILDKYKLIV